MKIAINGYEAVIPRFGFDPETKLPNRVGSGIYCYELLVSLSKIDGKNKYLIYLPENPTSDMPEESDNWKYKIIKVKKAWTLTALSLELIKKRLSIDVFFSPTHYLPISFPANSVVTILDVSYLHFPDMFSRKDLYKLKFWGGFSIRKAKKIITISNSSKSDIIKKYGIREDKVEVIYPAIKNDTLNNNSELSMDEIQKKFGIDGKYILFVGTLQPRKNIVRLIEAFSMIVSENELRDLKLVIVGRRGWQFEEILAAPEKFGVEKNVKFLSEVGNADLPDLYKNAEIFVLPSLYEGFGLPVLEAMNYGTAVITSNISSLPEAGGDGALYIDPKNTKDIAEKMKKLLTDDKLRRELIEKGYRQIKKFSWEKTAKQALRVLEEVGNDK